MISTLVLAAVLGGQVQPAKPNPEPIILVVEDVNPGGAAERAGLAVGDVLQAWDRTRGDDSEMVWIPFASPFDMNHLDVAESPRGPVVLKITRGEFNLHVELPPGRFRMIARPELPDDQADSYAEAIDRIRNDPEAGLQPIDPVKEWFQSRDQPELAAWTVTRAAGAAFNAGSPESAFAGFEQALAIIDKCSDTTCRHARPWIVHNMASYAKQAGRFDDAIRYQRQCIALWEAVKEDSLEEAFGRHFLGLVVGIRGENVLAEEYLRQALKIREQSAPRSLDHARSLETLGVILGKSGDLQGSEEALTQSLEIFEEIVPDGQLAAAVVTNLGQLAAVRGHVDEAEGRFKQALVIYERLAPRGHGITQVLINLGAMAMIREDSEVAKQYLTRALRLSEGRPEYSPKLALVLINLGVLAHRVGDLSEAEGYYARAREHYERLAPASQELATTLTYLGTVARERGDFSEAEAYYTRALEHHLLPGHDASEAAVVLGNLGNLALQRGDFESAKDFTEEALKLTEQRRPRSLEAAHLLNLLGVIARESGEIDVAVDLHGNALQIHEELAPESLAVAESLELVGSASLAVEEFDAARGPLEQSLEIRRRLAPGSLVEASSCRSLGLLARLEGRPEDALTLHHSALAIQRQLAPDSLYVAISLNDLATDAIALGRTEDSLAFLSEALEVFESSSARVGGTDWSRATYRSLHLETARTAIDVLVSLDRIDEAYYVLEQWRARELVTMLAERELVLSGVPAEVDRERRVLAVEYERTQGELAELSSETDSEEVEALLAELRRIRRRQEEVREEIRAASPRLAALERPEPLDVGGAQQTLDPDTVLLSYSVGEKRSHLFVLSSVSEEETPFASFTIDVGADDLAAEVERYREILSVRDPQTRCVVTEAGTALFSALVDPAMRWLDAADRIVISPDGPLHLLPFAALVRTGEREAPRYLVEWKPVHVVSSATVYAQLREPVPAKIDTGRQVVAFGDPRLLAAAESDEPQLALRSIVLRGRDLSPLPASRREVETIGALWGESSTLYLGESATEEAAKSIGAGVDTVHFACHAVVDDAVPLDSALVLSQPDPEEGNAENGLLQAWEIIEQVRLDADLVVLSACDSGLGKEVRGEGLYGLTRAFHYAGARSVVASLWAVPDASTAVLMRRFHEGLMAGLSKDEALRRAQVSLIREPIEVPDGQGGSVTIDASHPYAWAGFQLYGDWR